MAAAQRFGLLNVNKPAGLTSRRVVDHVAKIVRPEKAGHAGTLDPLATGVLVVCVGKATRLIEFVQEQPKTYEARFLLGCQSDTDDVTGTVTEVAVASEITHDPDRAGPSRILRTKLHRCRRAFPPCTSAGNRAYDLARRGEAVDDRLLAKSTSIASN